MIIIIRGGDEKMQKRKKKRGVEKREVDVFLNKKGGTGCDLLSKTVS
jgi:hypothetical protein